MTADIAFAHGLKGKTPYKPLYRKVSRPNTDKDLMGELPLANDPIGHRDFREMQKCCITLRGAHCDVGSVYATVSGCAPEIRFWDLGDCVRACRLINNPKYTRQKTPMSSIFCCNTNNRWL